MADASTEELIEAAKRGLAFWKGNAGRNADLARFLDVDRAQITRYAQGSVPIRGQRLKVLQYLADLDGRVAVLRERAERDMKVFSGS